MCAEPAPSTNSEDIPPYGIYVPTSEFNAYPNQSQIPPSSCAVKRNTKVSCSVPDSGESKEPSRISPRDLGAAVGARAGGAAVACGDIMLVLLFKSCAGGKLAKRGCQGGAERRTARSARASAFALHDDGSKDLVFDVKFLVCKWIFFWG